MPRKAFILSHVHGIYGKSAQRVPWPPGIISGENQNVLGFSCRPNSGAPTWVSSKTSPIEPADRGEGELSTVVKRRRAACPTRTRTSEWLCWEGGKRAPLRHLTPHAPNILFYLFSPLLQLQTRARVTGALTTLLCDNDLQSQGPRVELRGWCGSSR